MVGSRNFGYPEIIVVEALALHEGESQALALVKGDSKLLIDSCYFSSSLEIQVFSSRQLQLAQTFQSISYIMFCLNS